MIRIQAFIVSQDGPKYTVEASAEGFDTPFVFQIEAKSDNEAAMEAIHRVQALVGQVGNDTRGK